MKICDACYASMPDFETSCPSCGMRVHTEPVRALAPGPEVPPEPGPAVVDAPVAEPAPAPAEQAPRTECPKHSGIAALGACERCGTFYCGLCEPDAKAGAEHFCAACRLALAPEQRRKLLNEFLISAVVLAALMVGAPGILMATLGRTTTMLGSLVLGAMGAIVMMVIAVPLRLFGHPVLAWALFGYELLLFGGLFLLSPSLITGALLLAISGFSFKSASRLGELNKLTAAAQSRSSGGASM